VAAAARRVRAGLKRHKRPLPDGIPRSHQVMLGDRSERQGGKERQGREQSNCSEEENRKKADHAWVPLRRPSRDMCASAPDCL
jgi:hypothetical protein